MKSFRRSAGLFAVALLLGAATATFAEERVYAKAKEFTIKQEQLDASFIVYRATLAAQGRDVPEQQRPQIERQLVEKLALTRVLVGRSTDADRKTAREKADKVLAAEKARAKSQARYEAQVRALGMAPDDFEKQLFERAVCEQVLERELRPRLGITPEKIRAFYDENPEKFQQPERVRLRQIVLSLKNSSGNDLGEADKAEKLTLAKSLVERARKGEELESLARQYSDDPTGRERGGEYLFPVGRMIPEFELAILNLATNKVSDVITTQGALHVVKVLGRVGSDKTPFEQVQNQIRDGMEMEETAKQLPAYQQQLFSEAAVEFLPIPGSRPGQ